MPNGSSLCTTEINGAHCGSEARKARLFGIPFDNLTAAEMRAFVVSALEDRRPRMIFTANVHLVVTARQNENLRSVFERCDLLPVDGRGVYYASYIIGKPLREMVGAPRLFFQMLELANERGSRVFFFGASEENLQKALATVRVRYPNIVVAGARNGYFTTADEPAIAAQIRESRSDMLFLGMSSPRKEIFVDQYRLECNVPASLGVGGMFDVLAGVTQLAPHWIGVMGLEWFYRLLQEPRRLWKRYTTTNLIFLGMVIRGLWKKQS